MDQNSEEDVILETDNVIENNNTNLDVEMESEYEVVEDCIDMDEEINIVDKPIIIESSKRISKNKMTRYEFVRIIGERTKQLTMGAKPMIKQSKLSDNLTYSEIAIEELKLNMTPFKIRRPVKDHYEIWSIDELDKRHLESLF